MSHNISWRQFCASTGCSDIKNEANQKGTGDERKSLAHYRRRLPPEEREPRDPLDEPKLDRDPEERDPLEEPKLDRDPEEVDFEAPNPDLEPEVDFEAPNPVADLVDFVDERALKFFIDPWRLESELALGLATVDLPAANFELLFDADLMPYDAGREVRATGLTLRVVR